MHACVSNKPRDNAWLVDGMTLNKANTACIIHWPAIPGLV